MLKLILSSVDINSIQLIQKLSNKASIKYTTHISNKYPKNKITPYIKTIKQYNRNKKKSSRV